jgi:predicted GNAT family acetyltransferase
MAGVRDNPEKGRYELDTPAGPAFALYRRTPGVVVVTHTETPHALRGQGVGSQLVGGMLDAIRAAGLKVSPRCGFVIQYMADHPEYRDLVA